MEINRLLPLGIGIAAIFGANAAVPFQKGITPPEQHKAAKQHPSAGRSMKAVPAPQTVLDEDFSKFSAGTQDTPGAEIAYEDGYHIPDEMTAQPGWTGGGIYPAGGSIALMTRTNDNRLGFISTPPLPLGGTATLTLKARCLPGHSGGTLWIALCDDYYGPGEDQADIELTDEWKTYTLVATHAELDEYSYFQIQAENNFVQIDDVKIDFVRDRLPSPYANNAINVSPTEFIASWDDCDTPLYRLNVICKQPAADTEEGVLSESFDGINVNDDNTTINPVTPGYPEGWEIDLSTHGSKDVSKEAGTFHSAPLSLIFDETEDFVASPETPYPMDEVRFWVKPSGQEDNEYDMSLLRVEIYHSLTGTWENIAHLPYYWMEPEGGFYEFGSEALGEDATRLRLTLIQHGLVEFYVDDIELSYSAKGITSHLIKDLDIEATEYTVSDINPEYEYSYFVQAVDGDIVSAPSYVIWVDGIKGLKPELLEPTDITSDSFTANWKKLGHATDYKVETNCVIKADRDMPGTIINAEDFNSIQTSGNDWMSPYDFAAHGMASTGWCATQPAWQAGMAGTQGTSWLGSAGLVYSPTLDLSGNGGEGFDVEATVVTTVESIDDGYGNVYEEGIFVMVLNTPYDTQAVTAALIDTPTVGSHTAKVHVANPEGADLSNVIVAFMNKTGQAFYVDDVTIMQDLREGEEVAMPFSIAFTDATSLRVEGTNADAEYAYRVTASTRRNYEDFVSEPSEYMAVAKGTVGVDMADAQINGISISTSKGMLSVTASEADCIRIYSASGVLAAESKGSISLPLSAGIYVVKAGNMTKKVNVR